jgi:alanyl-tRNA synthetase
LAGEAGMKTEETFSNSFFEEEKFFRKKCEKCGAFFWTQDKKQVICQDQPCVEYNFLGASLVKKPLSCDSVRNRFLQFFVDNDHKAINPYPVVARWRDDIYLNIASISNFQPHITSEEVPPPANPLVIAQPCIRLNDLDLVGKSGRHLTQFEMLGHHAFNTPEQWIYWMDETVRYCDDFFHKLIGVQEGLTYKEADWAGGGNAGSCLEVLAGGLEVATLVFMDKIADPKGRYAISGEKYKDMRMKIVDTGYGLERIAWLSQGMPTVYDAAFSELIDFIRENSNLDFSMEDKNFNKINEESSRLSSVLSQKDPLFWKCLSKRLTDQNIPMDPDRLKNQLTPVYQLYQLADHVRSISHMLGDGLVPSNVRGGYLARLMLRRAYRLSKALRLKIDLSEAVDFHIKTLTERFPEYMEEEETIQEIVDSEVEKYQKNIQKGRDLLKRIIKPERKIELEEIIDLYDVHGIPPEEVQRSAGSVGVKIEIPSNFESLVAEKHVVAEEKKEKKEELDADVPPTNLLYYEDSLMKEFDGVVLYSRKKDDSTYSIALDKTIFYPEGGGQFYDRGTLITPEKSVSVNLVYKIGDVVIHEVNGELSVGEMVHGRLDWGRRSALMRNHSATHIINGSAQIVLGKHVWQAGSQVDVREARLDITHYKHLNEEEQREIETIANKIVIENIPIEKIWMDRNEAERKFGFRLYQGGVPKGKKIRVVRIPGYDVEACGGMHSKETADAGLIKILRTEHIQDGVERLVFTSGFSALKHTQYQDKLIIESANNLGVKPQQLPKATRRFFMEWKQQRKELARVKKELAREKGKLLRVEGEKIGDVTVIANLSDKNLDDLIKQADVLTRNPKTVAIVGSKKGGGKLIISRSSDVHLDCREVLKDAIKLVGGSGGGKENFAQGGGHKGEKIKDSIELAKNIVTKKLKEEGRHRSN